MSEAPVYKIHAQNILAKPKISMSDLMIAKAQYWFSTPAAKANYSWYHNRPASFVCTKELRSYTQTLNLSADIERIGGSK